jgi:c-di-GMP-binding flagellar brake protein YcgR
MSRNLRKHERKQTKINVELTLLDEPYVVVNTRDISQGGMFLEVNTAEKFPVGEMVSVHYLDPLNNDADTFKDAIIVHKNNDGFGICFIEMTEFKD